MTYSLARTSRAWTAVALLASLAWPAGPAAADVARPEGPGECGWSAASLPGGEQWAHVFRAGPLVVVDDDAAANPVSATVTCSVREGTLHTSPVIAEATSAPSPGVVAMPPTLVTAPVPDEAVLVVCTRVDVVGGPSFYSDGAGGWATDEESSCITAAPAQIPPREVFDLLDTVIRLTLLADGTVCPALAGLAPGAGQVTIDETGDTYVAGTLLWDCPPYE